MILLWLWRRVLWPGDIIYLCKIINAALNLPFVACSPIRLQLSKVNWKVRLGMKIRWCNNMQAERGQADAHLLYCITGTCLGLQRYVWGNTKKMKNPNRSTGFLFFCCCCSIRTNRLPVFGSERTHRVFSPLEQQRVPGYCKSLTLIYLQNAAMVLPKLDLCLWRLKLETLH